MTMQGITLDIDQWLSQDWVLHEEEMVSKQPYSVKNWIDYLNAVDDAILEKKKKKNKQQHQLPDHQLIAARDWIGRRALALLPRSYKLWKLQWEFLVAQHAASNTTNSGNSIPTSTVVACFERAVLTLSSYPRVWMDYIEFLFQNPTAISFTEHRRIWNRAFQSTAIAQHEKIWGVVADKLLTLDYDNSAITNEAAADDDNGMQLLPWESANRVLKRYCILKPDFTVEYAAWCEKHGKWGVAAVSYQELLNRSNSSQQDQQHWQSFCELVAQHSVDVENAGVPWEAILKTAITQQQEESAASAAKKKTAADGVVVSASSKTNTMLGLLYSWLASAWIQRGSFDMARSVYEEGLLTVRTVRDFSILFAAYLQLEEGLLTAITDSMEEEDMDVEDSVDTAAKEESDWDLLLSAEQGSAQNRLAEMELAMARAEHLTARRPLLLNAVKLRQNPNDCAEWIQRADLYVAAEQARQAAASLEEALQTVKGAAGLNQVVARLAKVYEDSMDDVAAARDLLDRVCRQRSTATGMAKSEELAECWAAWIELELKHENWDEALSLARQSVAPVGRGRRRLNVTKSLRLWDLLLDLEESLGTVQTTKDAYNRALEIKVATVQHVLNFGTFLTEQKYFEESFSAYERGIELFSFPHAGAKLLWKAYLEAFLRRYMGKKVEGTERSRGTKIERARNLFHRCLESCPAEECAEFYLLNGAFEEEHGLTKRALSVYKAMCEQVPPAEKYTAYQLYIAKTVKYLGVEATRDIYQEAIEKLKDPKSAVMMCQDFAKMEMGLQQVDRARAIFAYGAQSADPRRLPEYWKEWNDFEIANGNEETFREMLRVKRSVGAAFSTVNYNATGMTEKTENLSNEEAMAMIASSEGVELDQPKKSAVSGFVASKRTAAAASLDDMEERVAKLRKATGAAAAESSANEGTRVDDNKGGDDDDDDEIDLDDIDAEIEEAAAEGAVHTVQDISTKAVPEAVFGGLAAAQTRSTKAK